jgi:hypothetical protein
MIFTSSLVACPSRRSLGGGGSFLLHDNPRFSHQHAVPVSSPVPALSPVHISKNVTHHKFIDVHATTPPLPLAIWRRLQDSACEKGADQACDFGRMSLKREVARIKEMDLRTRNIAPERLGTCKD